ncbi:hypothetical protein GCM10010254_61030 [Streptomyces chromofuscus]|nr:hypothetical protein GCM10010254_61030 [Streptomyces chromofuscus]
MGDGPWWAVAPTRRGRTVTAAPRPQRPAVARAVVEAPSSAAPARCGTIRYTAPPTSTDSRKPQSTPPVTASNGPSYDGQRHRRHSHHRAQRPRHGGGSVPAGPVPVRPPRARRLQTCSASASSTPPQRTKPIRAITAQGVPIAVSSTNDVTAACASQAKWPAKTQAVATTTTAQVARAREGARQDGVQVEAHRVESAEQLRHRQSEHQAQPGGPQHRDEEWRAGEM